MAATTETDEVRFGPRRLAHANLFVGHFDRSMDFYTKLVGLELVRLEPGIGAGFLSNGNTHHDVALMQISPEAKVGQDGYVQVQASRGRRPGLNHFGWEMESEAELVAAYHRALEAGVRIHRTTDHQISHSVYLFDPEDNLNEFYADATANWRSIFNLDREDLVSNHWDPDSVRSSKEPKYAANPEIRRVEGAIFHPLRITHGVIIARDFERVRDFYTGVAGLQSMLEDEERTFVKLGGRTGRFDLAIFAANGSTQPGLHHIALELADETEFDRAENALSDRGVQPELRLDLPEKCSLFTADPNGMRVELYCRRDVGADPAVIGESDPARRPYLV